MKKVHLLRRHQTFQLGRVTARYLEDIKKGLRALETYSPCKILLQICQVVRMDKTNSARTTVTEVGSVNGRLPNWRELMDALGTEDFMIFYGFWYFHRIAGGGSTVNGRVAGTRDLEKHIMEALRDPNVYMIGVCGEDLRQLDSLLDTVTRIVTRDNLFDMMVTECMRHFSDLTKIQKKIASKLGFSYQEEEKGTSSSRIATSWKKKAVIAENAKQLSDRIRTQPNILFILHDLISTLDLAKVGIPFDVDQIGCKLILTSNSEEILSKMNVQRTFRI